MSQLKATTQSDRNQELLIERVKKALQLAKTAIDYDANRQDYANAILKYKETILILESEAKNAPVENQKEMTELVRESYCDIYSW